MLWPCRVPDRLPEGELPRRIHDERADGIPGQRREGRRGDRRMPAPRDRGPAARCPREPSGIHRRGRRDPIRTARGQERRRGSDRVDHRGPPGGRAVQIARRLLLAHRPSADELQGPRVVDEGGRPQRLRPSGPGPRQPREGDVARPAAPGERSSDQMGFFARRNQLIRGDAARRTGGPDARTASLGEGAARALPLGAPDGRGRRPGRRVRQRLQRRPARRIARWTARRGGRHRHRDQDGHHEGESHDGDRHARGPAGDHRGGRLSPDVGGDAGDVDGGGDPARPGRVDHRGEEVSLLADAAWEWDAVVVRGEVAFESEVAASDRGSRGRGRFGGSRANGQNGSTERREYRRERTASRSYRNGRAEAAQLRAP